MPTTAQRFYLSATDDDQAYGTTVKKVIEAAPAANSATTMTWTSTTAAVRTHIPLAGSTAATDTSDANGWGINNGGADGLGSVAGAERWIKAGVWSFSMAYTLNTPALLATIACTVTARVYRVSAAGVRTLLFTAASANFSATGTITWSSAAQPEYVFAPGETIHVGYTAVSAATNNALTGTVNTVLTLALGANTRYDVPAPGIRTLAQTVYALTGLGTTTAALTRVVGAAFALAGLGSLAAAATARFAATYAMTGTGTASLAGSSVSGTSFAASGTGTHTARLTRILSGAYAMDSGNPNSAAAPAAPTIRPIFIFDD